MPFHSARQLLQITFIFAAFLMAGEAHPEAPRPHAPAAILRENPPGRSIDANLWMQTSAEYRASCYQAYSLATLRVQQALQQPAKSEKPRAVILDLDETVLDNAGFQAMESRAGILFDDRLWDDWQKNHGSGLAIIPGAKEFIDAMGPLGVSIVYISNRSAKFQAETKQGMTDLGLPVSDEALLLNNGQSSSKTERIAAAASRYDILLIVGDNLRDFDDRFKTPALGSKTPAELKAAVAKRKAEVDACRSEFGQRWIILPNPVYGEWLKPLGNGTADLDLLATPPAP